MANIHPNIFIHSTVVQEEVFQSKVDDCDNINVFTKLQVYLFCIHDYVKVYGRSRNEYYMSNS